MRKLESLLAILQGKAIVLIKSDEHRANVLVGKNVNKQFAISCMAEVIKALM